MPLHIIIVLYKCADALPRFLDCLKAQTLQDWRLTAVANGFVDRSPFIVHEAAREWGAKRIHVVFNDTNLGFARAANRGLLIARRQPGDLFLLLNVDTAFEPDFLAELVAAQQRLAAPVLAPRIMSMETPDKAWYAGGHFEHDWVFANVHEPYDREAPAEQTVAFASGCCLLLTRGALRHCPGPFDTRFFVYWEDADLCLRFAQLGVSITYVAEPSLLHAGAASSGGVHSPAHDRLYYRSYAQFLRKHFGIGEVLRTAARLTLRDTSGSSRDVRGAARRLAAMLLGAGGVRSWR